MIAKQETYEEAVVIFEGTGISITNAGKQYLRGALGSDDFPAKFAEGKISQWVLKIKWLSTFARPQPQRSVCHILSWLAPVTLVVIEECLMNYEVTVRS